MTDLGNEIIKTLMLSKSGPVYHDPQRMGATGMNLQLPIRAPMSQAEPQTFEETKEQIVPSIAGLAAGPAVGIAELGDLGIGLMRGAYRAANPDADEGRFQAFMSGLSDQFEGGAGEAVRSKVMELGEAAGYNEQQMQVLDEAMTVGSFFGYGGAVKAAPKVLSKAGDMVEGAGDAAKARMAEGGVTLTSGVNPDPLIAAAGDAVAKFRAPTEKQPGIIAFHGSGADFDEFKLEKIGTGEGAQAYGYGLYFTDSEDIAKFYRDSVGGANVLKTAQNIKIKAPSGGTETAANFTGFRNKFAKFYGEDAALFADRYLGQFSIDPDAPKDVLIERAKVLMADIKEADKIPKNAEEIVSKITLPERGKMYKVGLAPKPDELLNYQTTFAEQTENVKAAVKKLGYDPDKKFEAVQSGENRVSVMSEDALGEEERKDFIDGPFGKTAQKQADEYIAEQKEKMLKMPMPLVLDELKTIIAQEPRRPDAPSFKKKDAEKILSERLSEQGVPGIKYRAAGSRSASLDEADAEMNYVIFDDNMIKILEKYGIVGPVAITGIAASKQESEPDAGA